MNTDKYFVDETPEKSQFNGKLIRLNTSRCLSSIMDTKFNNSVSKLTSNKRSLIDVLIFDDSTSFVKILNFFDSAYSNVLVSYEEEATGCFNILDFKVR